MDPPAASSNKRYVGVSEMAGPIGAEKRASSAGFDEQRPSPMERFKANMKSISELICELVEDANNKGCKVVNITTAKLGVAFLEAYDPTQLIESFIERSHEYWDSILKKDENFFNQNLGTVFSGISSSNSDAFRKLAIAKDGTGRSIISDDDKEDIWIYIRSFVKIAIAYIHDKRMPDVMNKDGQLVAVYRQNFMPKIKLEEHAQKWRITFTFKRRSNGVS